MKRYEGFTVEHARLCDDARTRVDRGGSWPTDADREFVRVFEQHLDEQPLALAHAAAVVDVTAARLAAAEEAHAAAVAVHAEVTASA